MSDKARDLTSTGTGRLSRAELEAITGESYEDFLVGVYGDGPRRTTNGTSHPHNGHAREAYMPHDPLITPRDRPSPASAPPPMTVTVAPLRPRHPAIALWEELDKRVALVEQEARVFLQRLLGSDSHADLHVPPTQELHNVYEEARVQALIMEIKDIETLSALERSAALRRDARRVLMEELESIKEDEKAYAWAETPEERHEAAEQGKHLRAHAREAVFRTLEMGQRRIDEQVDRTLHPADPDFPKRTGPVFGGTAFERFRDALRRPPS